MMNGGNVAFAVAREYQGPGVLPFRIVAYPALGCFVVSAYKKHYLIMRSETTPYGYASIQQKKMLGNFGD